jgi:hypothetical protein
LDQSRKPPSTNIWCDEIKDLMVLLDMRIPTLVMPGTTRALHSVHMESTMRPSRLSMRAIRLDPNSPDAWHNKGLTLEALGRATEAEAAFSMANELESEGKPQLL